MPPKRTRRVLVVDDDAVWHPIFVRRFEAIGSRPECPYDFEVETIGLLSDGVARIQELRDTARAFDVVVFDMWMADNKTAGLAGVRGMTAGRQKSEAGLPPLIIVFTGHPTYPNCVEALRNGAWDFIVKEDVGNTPAAQLVVNSAIEGLRLTDLRQCLEQRVAIGWWPEHREEMIAKYPGQLLALWHEPSIEVVASGGDSFELERKLAAWRVGHEPWHEPLILQVPSPGADPEGRLA